MMTPTLTWTTCFLLKFQYNFLRGANLSSSLKKTLTLDAWRMYSWASGRHGPRSIGPACPTGRALEARGPGLRPRHGPMGLFSCRVSSLGTTNFDGPCQPITQFTRNTSEVQNNTKLLKHLTSSPFSQHNRSPFFKHFTIFIDHFQS
jgi:hypothetical protein